MKVITNLGLCYSNILYDGNMRQVWVEEKPALQCTVSRLEMTATLIKLLALGMLHAPWYYRLVPGA